MNCGSAELASGLQAGPGLPGICGRQVGERGRDPHGWKHLAEIEILRRPLAMLDRMSLSREPPELIHRQRLELLELLRFIVVDRQPVVEHLTQALHVGIMAH